MRSSTSATTSSKSFPIDFLGCCIWLRSVFCLLKSFPALFLKPFFRYFFQFQAEYNSIPSLPSDIGLCSALTCLHLTRNKIAELPIRCPIRSCVFLCFRFAFVRVFYLGANVLVAASLTATPASRASASSERWMPVTTHSPHFPPSLSRNYHRSKVSTFRRIKSAPGPAANSTCRNSSV